MLLITYLAATAATLTAPSFDRVLSPDDYPEWAVRQEASGAALIEATVDATGRISDCRTISTIGSERLGRDICPIVEGRRATPARDSTGAWVQSRVTTLLKMFIWPPSPLIEKAGKGPDLILTVEKLPDGARIAEVEVVLEVDPTGTVKNCVSKLPAASGALVTAACADLRKSRMADRLSGRFVTSRNVQFRAETPPPDSSAANPR